VTLDAYANQEVPFEKLVERLKPVRVEGRTPIFQAKIVLQNAPSSALDLPGLKLEIMGADTGETKDDLLLSVTPMTRGLRAQMTFKLSLYSSSWATRFLEQLEMILAEVAHNPDVRMKELTRLLAESDSRLQALKEQELGQARQKSLNKIRSGSASRAVAKAKKR
jgi:aspartate racemase